jgi:putative FmdB family regulatory protein
VPNYDFCCSDCGATFVDLLPMSECTTPQTCHECGGIALRAYIKAPEINDSSSAIHVVKPPEYTHFINTAKAQNRWKKIKDKKKKAEAKAEAASMSRFKT